EIWDIPISTITDQFIETIRQWEEMDLDLAGDFILMAATLLEIKSRAIAPVEESEVVEDDDELIDPRADLVRQLLAFRACKDWADRLESCEQAHRQRHARRYREDIPDAPEDEEGCDLENADPYQLFRLWDKILADITGKGPRTVVYDDVPIEDRVRQIVASMKEAREGKLSWLMGHVDTRIKRVGVFVALLECVRKRAVEAIQHEQYEDVYLLYREEDQRAVPEDPSQSPTAQEVDPGDEIDSPTPTGPDGRKRRRRRGPLQLFTYHAPVLEMQELIPEVEELLQAETEEDRFRRELNERTAVDDVLGTVKHFDAQLHEHLVLRRICQGPLTETMLALGDRRLAEEVSEQEEEEEETADADPVQEPASGADADAVPETVDAAANEELARD
ncbi:MAG: segregation and condensation protein A, partial [Planctomycetota bacterium]